MLRNMSTIFSTLQLASVFLELCQTLQRFLPSFTVVKSKRLVKQVDSYLFAPSSLFLQDKTHPPMEERKREEGQISQRDTRNKKNERNTKEQETDSSIIAG